MNDNRIATVGDLIAALDRYEPATPVRCATQPGYPSEHTIGRVVRTPGDPDSDCVLPNGTPVVRIGTGQAYRCLPDKATDTLGWS